MGMADVLPVNPGYPVEREMNDNVDITEISGNLERRKLISGINLSTWNLSTENMKADEAEALDAFWVARNGRFDPFSFLPPKNNYRIVRGISVGTGDGVTTEFDLGNTDYYRRVYLGADTRNVAYVNGSPVSATFSNDDGTLTSKVTYASPPAGSAALTVDIDRYLICRFDARLKSRLVAYLYSSAAYIMKEIPRDSI